jgi:retron-type reverse transcriptase
MSFLRQALRTSSLIAAFAKVEDKHGAAGTDGQTVANFADHLQTEIKALQWDVMQRRYAPMLRVWLPRPANDDGSAKPPRPIGIPAVRDRVLHSAIATALTPRFEAEFDDCSFAYRQGRSVRQAVARIERYQREGFTWLVDADISACFDSIPHEPLLARVAAIAPDAALSALLRIILQTPVQDGSSLQPTHKASRKDHPYLPCWRICIWTIWMRRSWAQTFAWCDMRTILWCWPKTLNAQRRRCN